jgi:hypothetical protein
MAYSLMNDYQLFPKEYFTGIDVYVSFDNIIIDQIVTIQMALQEPVIPIYGYASYTYDAVAHGARLVNGAFRVNYKESMYIPTVLNKLINGGVSSSAPKTPTSSSTSSKDVLAWIKGQKFDDIEKAADDMGTKLWGKQKSSKGKYTTTTSLNKYAQPFFTPRGTALHQAGFDIILSYGSELLELGVKYQDFPGTVKIINGVHLTGVSQIIQPTGDAIFEEYTFIAKDLDNTLTKL